MKTTLRSLTALAVSCTLLAVPAGARQTAVSSTQGWPGGFTNNGTSFTVYRPQATSLDNGVLSFRMAVSAALAGRMPTQIRDFLDGERTCRYLSGLLRGV